MNWDNEFSRQYLCLLDISNTSVLYKNEMQGTCQLLHYIQDIIPQERFCLVLQLPNNSLLSLYQTHFLNCFPYYVNVRYKKKKKGGGGAHGISTPPSNNQMSSLGLYTC